MRSGHIQIIVHLWPAWHQHNINEDMSRVYPISANKHSFINSPPDNGLLFLHFFYCISQYNFVSFKLKTIVIFFQLIHICVVQYFHSPGWWNTNTPTHTSRWTVEDLLIILTVIFHKYTVMVSARSFICLGDDKRSSILVLYLHTGESKISSLQAVSCSHLPKRYKTILAVTQSFI